MTLISFHAVNISPDQVYNGSGCKSCILIASEVMRYLHQRPSDSIFLYAG